MVTSADFPSPYPKSSDCLYRIELEEGFFITLSFEDSFDVEDHPEVTCPYDYIKVSWALHTPPVPLSCYFPGTLLVGPKFLGVNRGDEANRSPVALLNPHLLPHLILTLSANGNPLSVHIPPTHGV